MNALSDNLLIRLQNADVVCKDCGAKYGKYSVGCSSIWVGECNVCEVIKPVTEVRDYGYLAKGIQEERARLVKQSKEVANYIAGQEEVSLQEEDEPASYEEGNIACKFTEAEVTALAKLVDNVAEKYPPGQDVALDSVFEKVLDLYGDYCVKYELSPAMKAYYEKYGNFGSGSPEDEARWEGFRDAFNSLYSPTKENS